MSDLDELQTRASSLLSDLLGICSSVGDKLDEELTKTQNQRKIAQTATTEAQEAVKGLEELKKAVEMETEHLEGQVEIHKKELRRLKDESSALLAKKIELSEANVKLDQENKKFVEYEKKAWKVLNAKDEELKSRQKAVEEQEQYKPRMTSFLPPDGE